MATLDTNKVIGVSTATNSTDAAYKGYVDGLSGGSGGIPSTTGNNGEFLSVYPGSSYWVTRTSGFGTTNINTVTFGGSYFVASGNTGTITASTDSVSWSLRTSGFGTSSINGATYFNSEHLIGGRVETITWTLRTLAQPTGSSLSVRSLIYANSLWVCGYNGSPRCLSTSTDAIHWTLRTSPGSGAIIHSISYTDIGYIAVDSTTQITTSTDAIHWILRTSGRSTSTVFYTSAYASNLTEKYLAAGLSGVLSTSTNSIQWSGRTSGFGTSIITSSTYYNGIYVIGGSISSGNARISTSTDGISWVARTLGLTGSGVEDLIYGERYVASGWFGIAVSSDAIIWSIRTCPKPGGSMYTVTYSNGLYVTSGRFYGDNATSTDTIVWVLRTSGFGSDDVNKSTNDGTTFLIGGQNGKIATSSYETLYNLGNGGLLRTSTDSISWTTRTTSGNMVEVSYLSSGGSYSAIVGKTYEGSIYPLAVSTDNINWILRTSGFGATTVSSFVYGNNLYVISGSTSLISTSTDTITWTARTNNIPQGQTLSALSYGSGYYVASGTSGTIISSTDGISWDLRTSGFGTTNITSALYANNNHILGTANGEIQTSTDSIVWVPRYDAITAEIDSIASSSSLGLIAGGNSGTIIYSSTSQALWQTVNATTSSASNLGYKGYQEFTTAGAQTFIIPPGASQFYIEAIGGGGGGNGANNGAAGAGGGSGAYNAWLIKRSEFGDAASLTVTPGSAGTAGVSGTAGNGENTTVSWTGKSPIGTATYTLTSNGGTGATFTTTAGTGGSAASVTLNPIETTAGLSGGAGLSSWAPGNNATTQTNPFQVTGGGGGAYNTNPGGSSSTYYYGNLYTAFGGSASGGAGDNGIPLSYTGSYGSGGGGGGALSTGFNSWYLRTSGFGTSNINTATYFNSEYLIGGRGPETISWVLRTTGFGSTSITSLVYGNGIYVITGENGSLRASTNGISWVLRTAPALSPYYSTNSSIYDGTNYFIVGGFLNPGRLIVSTDTISWTLRTSGFGSTAIYAISYGSSKTQKYIIVGFNGLLRSSTDSIAWTLRTSGFGTSTIRSLIFDGTNYYVGGELRDLRYSTDGIVWSLTGNNPSSSPSTAFSTLLYANNTYIAGTNGGQLISSTNGSIWLLRTSGFGTSQINALTYNSNVYVAGSAGGRIATSTDAITWISRTSGTVSDISQIQTDGTDYVSVGSAGYSSTSTQQTLSNLGDGALLRASTDSISWTTRTTSGNMVEVSYLSSGGSYSAIVGKTYEGNIYPLASSTDNINWFLRTSGFGTSTISALGYSNNEFLSSVTLSSAVVVWTLRTSGFGTSSITNVTFGGSNFIASGVSGTLTASTDGVYWILRTSGFGTSIIDGSTYFNNEYLICGYSVPIIMWTLRTTGTSSLFRSLTFGNGVYVASGGGSTSLLISSTNAVEWSLRTSSNNNINVSSGYGNNLYLLGSAPSITKNTIISSSTDSIVWELRTAGHTDGVELLTYQNSLYFSSSSRGTAFSFTDENAWGVSGNQSAVDRYDHDGNEFIFGSGNNFYITVGDDPYVWILRTTGISSSNITSVACAPNGPYVISGGGLTSGGYIRSSTDSIHWFARTSRISDYSSNHAAYYNGIFAVSSQYGLQSGNGPLVVTSTNSIVWIVRTVPLAFTYSTAVLSVANGFWVGQFNSSSYSTDGINWRIRTVPNIRGNDVNEYKRGVGYGNNVYVHVGGGSGSTDLSSSTDSIHWVLRTCPKTYLGFNENAIIFANNIFIVSGPDFTGSTTNIATSTNGIHWFLRTSALLYSESSNSALGYGNGILFSGANILTSKNNTFSVSTDSITWTLRTTGIQSQVQTLMYGNSLYVAAGTGGSLITSTDNISWIIRTQPIRHNFQNSVFDGTNYIVCGDNGSIIVSTNSIIWSLRTCPLRSKIYDVTYNNTDSLYVVNGYNIGPFSISGNMIAISTNNIIWTLRTSNQNSGSNITRNRLLFGNSLYLESSDSGIISTVSADTLNNYQPGGAFLRASTDSISWSTRTTEASIDTLNTLSTGGGYIFGMQSGSGYLTVSTDNINWTLRTTGFGTTGVHSLAYGNGYYVAGLSASANAIWASTDTITWQIRTSSIGIFTLQNVFYGQLFLATTTSTQIHASTNSIVWFIRTSPVVSGAYRRGVYNSNLYLLVSNSSPYANTAVSTDTIVWFVRTTNINTPATGVAVGNDTYVYGNNTGGLETSTQTLLSSFGIGAFLGASTDTITWTLRTATLNTNNINAISNIGTYALASAINTLNEYKIIASTDNINWQLRDFTGFGTTAINAFVYGTLYVASGNNGRIAASTDTIMWVLRTSGFGTSAINSLAYTSSGYVAAGVSGSVRTSTDTIVWTVRTANLVTTNINNVVTSGTLYVLSGNAARVSSASTITASVAGAGGAGTRGGGGGGGGYAQESNTNGAGGAGGTGYVKISWW